jgi:hypothetical protein
MSTGYGVYQASQPMIDAMWGLIDKKSHDKYAAQTFNDINKVADMGTQMGGWNAMGNFGQ